VAIGASNITLPDLESQRVNVPAPNEPRDLGDFRRAVAMIEVKDDWICFAAVDARVCQKIFVCDTAAFIPIAPVTVSRSLEVCLAIALVMSATVGTAAVPAVASPETSGAVFDRELAERLHEPTH